MRKRNVTARVLNGFDDPTLDPAQWEKLLSDCQTDIVYLTWEWQRTWWEVFQPGELLLIAVERNGELVAIAPLYVDSGMAYFVGSGFESGYLNFIGETKTGVLDAILGTVCDRFPDLEGFEFYFVPDNSGTGRRLRGAAGRFSLDCYETDRVAGPVLNLASPEIALAATQKKDALQHERMLRREGKLEISCLREGEAILTHLEEFFAQHTAQWIAKTGTGRFQNPQQRNFIERLTKVAASTGWLRFIRADWNRVPIAFQYGFCYRGRFVRQVSSFAIDMARYAPGQVLLRHSFLLAIEEGAHTYDFGIGDQPYKHRFASHINHVRTWGLYQHASSPNSAPEVQPHAIQPIG